MKEKGPFPDLTDILIDQGSEDGFLKQKQLLPEAFEVFDNSHIINHYYCEISIRVQ